MPPIPLGGDNYPHAFGEPVARVVIQLLVAWSAAYCGHAD